MPSLAVMEIALEANVVRDAGELEDEIETEMVEVSSTTLDGTTPTSPPNDSSPRNNGTTVPHTTELPAVQKSKQSKKRRVTPNQDPRSRKKQQQENRTANQLTLKSFFSGGSKTTTTSSATNLKTSSPMRNSISSPERETAPEAVIESPFKKTRVEEESVSVKETSSKCNTHPVVARDISVITPGSDQKETKLRTSSSLITEDDVPAKDEDEDYAAKTEDPKPTNAKPSDWEAMELDKFKGEEANEDLEAIRAPLEDRTVLSHGKVTIIENSKAKEDKNEVKSTKELAGENKESSDDEVTAIEIPTVKEVWAEVEKINKIPEDRKALLQRHDDIRERYLQRANKLVLEARGGLDEEDFEFPELKAPDEEIPSDQEFPSSVVSNMVVLIEGSSLPLSKLTSKVVDKLGDCYNKKWSADAVAAKIKLLAKRKPCLEPTSISRCLDLFEDDSQDCMWRWEIATVDLLPYTVLPNVRKARLARKKLSGHYSATNRLLRSLKEAEDLILDVSLPNLEVVLAKISREEDNVLNYEREAEKRSFVQQAKKKKDEEIEFKRREKELLAEEKRKEKERKKQEAEQAREEAKRKKVEERAKVEEEKKREEEEKIKKLTKQKACLMSFLAKPKSQDLKSVAGTGEEDLSNHGSAKLPSHTKPSSGDFDVDNFRSLIDSLDAFDAKHHPFKDLSKKAARSRKRQTSQVSVSVYVTVVPEDAGFDDQPFAEQRIIRIPNKYRFLSFHEDCRPPYHGTWSKRSSIVKGRKPFGKDTEYLDYDYDSEAEWEEGDDEIGEDIEDDAKNQDDDEEEGDAKMYDFNDGFCVADDQYLDIDENVDEETRALYKKKLQSNGTGSVNRVCIIAPAPDGMPIDFGHLQNHNFIEGFDKEEFLDILSSHKGKQLYEDNLWLDAFPPTGVDDEEMTIEAANPSGSAPLSKDEYTTEEMKIFATLVHHCTHKSKEKLVEELRNSYPTIFTSRAKAIRKLDSIAVKMKHPNLPGVYWEVKKQVLEENGLFDLVEKKMPGTEEQPVNVASKQVEGASKSAENSSNLQPVKKRGRKLNRAVLTSEEQQKQPKRTKNCHDSLINCVPKAAKRPESQKSSSIAKSANLLASFLIKPKKKVDESSSSSGETGSTTAN